MNKGKANTDVPRLEKPDTHGKPESCGNCYFWENRPELEMDTNTGFCAHKKAFKSRRSKCKKYCRKGALDPSVVLGGPGIGPEDDEDMAFYDN
jgi:hypothetical protein